MGTTALFENDDFNDLIKALNASNPHHIFNLASLCGMTVDLQRGTSQELAIAAQSKQCQTIGLRGINVLAYPTDGEALKQFLAGKSMAHISDYPVVSHLARTLGGGGKYMVTGQQFGVVPYGIAVSKKNIALRDRVQNALRVLISDGTYDALLKKWNAGTKFQ